MTLDKNTNTTQITGFVRGNTGLNANQLVHITGYDDFQIEKIEVLKNPFKIEHKKNDKNDDTFTFKNGQNNTAELNDTALFTQFSDPTLIVTNIYYT